MTLSLSSPAARAISTLQTRARELLRTQTRVLNRQLSDQARREEEQEKCQKLYQNRVLYARRGASKLLKALNDPTILQVINLLHKTGSPGLFLYGTHDKVKSDASVQAKGKESLVIRLHADGYEEDLGNLEEIVRSRGGDQYTKPYPILHELRDFLSKHFKGSDGEAVKAIDGVDPYQETPMDFPAVGVIKFLVACNKESFIAEALTSAIEKAVPKKSRKRDRKQ